MLNKKLLDVLFCHSVNDLFYGISEYIESASFTPFTVWRAGAAICEPVAGKYKNADGRYDAQDMGYNGSDYAGATVLEFFDERIENFNSVFFAHAGHIYGVVTFHGETDKKLFMEFVTFAPYIGQRFSELTSRERNINVYVDYQKKIEFVKQSGRILRAVEVDEVVAVALNFFMEVFSAEAGCVLFRGEFKGFGLELDDLKDNITIAGETAYARIASVMCTEFIEEGVYSGKFNINNAFVVYEETNDIRIVLFNIHFDVIPDKEFSELVSSIVSTAVENAVYHQKMTKLKVQESEMSATGEILNKFVSTQIECNKYFSLKGINHPARAAGGDYMTVKETEKGTFFCIADVCGKGYSAAVFTVVLSVFTENADFFSGDIALDVLAGRLNSFLLQKNFGDRFITAFFGFIDKNDNSLRYLSCGHEPAIVFSDEDRKITSDFLPIGLMDEEYSVKRVDLKKGDSLFVYTDGLIEYIGEDGLMSKVKELAKSGSDNILEVLYQDLVTDKEMQKDDFTCMIIRI